MGVAAAEVLDAGPRRSTIEFVTPDRVTYRPELGVLYPSELDTGMRIYVEYDSATRIVRVQHRNASLAIIPAGSSRWSGGWSRRRRSRGGVGAETAGSSADKFVEPARILSVDNTFGVQVVNRRGARVVRVLVSQARPVGVVDRGGIDHVDQLASIRSATVSGTPLSRAIAAIVGIVRAVKNSDGGRGLARKPDTPSAMLSGRPPRTAHWCCGRKRHCDVCRRGTSATDT